MSLGDITLGFLAGLGTGLAIWFGWSRILWLRASRKPRRHHSASGKSNDGEGTHPNARDVSASRVDGRSPASSPDTKSYGSGKNEWAPSANLTVPSSLDVPGVTVENSPEQPKSSGLGGQEISRRVILHLIKQGPLYDADVAPLSSTQEGMATALAVRQGSLAKVLQRLVASGALSVERRHVALRSTRLKVYRLTPLGVSVARELQRR